MPKTFFISYRREDVPDIAGRIYDKLIGQFGAEHVFKDVYSVRPGENFEPVIAERIAQSDYFLLLIGPKWLETCQQKAATNAWDWSRRELMMALEASSIDVIPVLVGGATMPAPEDLPEDIRDLMKHNVVHIRRDPDFHSDVERMLKGLAISPTKPQPPSSKENISIRKNGELGLEFVASGTPDELWTGLLENECIENDFGFNGKSSGADYIINPSPADYTIKRIGFPDFGKDTPIFDRRRNEIGVIVGLNELGWCHFALVSPSKSRIYVSFQKQSFNPNANDVGKGLAVFDYFGETFFKPKRRKYGKIKEIPLSCNVNNNTFPVFKRLEIGGLLCVGDGNFNDTSCIAFLGTDSTEITYEHKFDPHQMIKAGALSPGDRILAIILVETLPDDPITGDSRYEAHLKLFTTGNGKEVATVSLTKDASYFDEFEVSFAENQHIVVKTGKEAWRFRYSH